MAVEAGIPYVAVAMRTDYDCWKTDEPPVSWDEIVTIFKENAGKVTSVLIEVVGKMERRGRLAGCCEIFWKGVRWWTPFLYWLAVPNPAGSWHDAAIIPRSRVAPRRVRSRHAHDRPRREPARCP